MAKRYVLKFTKSGYAKYTSHLDMLRFFKRAFRKAGVALKYSQGFNPHPKMGFAQPLSLGYLSSCELLEFETEEEQNPEEIFGLLEKEMPEGLEIKWVRAFYSDVKSLAAAAERAEYRVWIPFEGNSGSLKDMAEIYLAQEEIIAMKRRKKDKKLAPVNIKGMIRAFDVRIQGGNIVLDLDLDCGSVSNCSPELVISSFLESAGMDIPRYKIEVSREKLGFVNNLQI